MCQAHWSDLRTALDERGLTHLISTSAENLVERMESKEDQGFDPLFSASIEIMAAALRDGGLALLQSDKCPLCEAEKSVRGLANDWIEGCSDDQLRRAKELGLAAVN